MSPVRVVVLALREDGRVSEDAYAAKPGDLCRLLGGGLVEHWKCDQWRDGVVTDVRTGTVVEPRRLR